MAAAVSVGVAGALLSPPLAASAAPTDIVINELMYHALSDLDGDDYVELHNRGTTAQDVSGWSMTGVTVTFAAGTSIPAGGFLVVAKDAVRFQSTYGFAPAAVYTGNLSNSGEAVNLRDAAAAPIDSVAYTTEDPWPVTPDGTGPSVELIDAALDNNDPLNWAPSTAGSLRTPGAPNAVRGTGLGPRIASVSATPAVPAANQQVTVTATITGQTSASLRYRVDFGAEQTAALTPAGGDVHTATLPGVAAGHLLRYRVEAANSVRTTRFPRVGDTEVYKGVVAASGVTSAVPILEWFIAESDYTTIVNNPEADITRSAVLAYAGTVYDNVAVNIRGETTQLNPKTNWKFELPKNHPILFPGLVEPVDEFAMQADWSDATHGRPLLAWDSYRKAGVVDTQVFPVRTQRNAAFQGLYTYVDLFDGTWREREGYDSDQFFKAGHSAFDARRPLEEYRFEKKNPPDGDFSGIRTFLDGVDLTGTAQRNHLLATADLPNMINYAAATAIVEHVDSISKNFYLSQDSVSGRWEIIPWDLDHTFDNGCCNVNSTFVTPAEPGDQTSELMRAVLAVPEWREMYFRRLKTLVNEIYAPGALENLYDARVGPAAPEATLDFQRWPRGNNLTYAGQRRSLFDSIAARRAIFTNDARVPGNQPVAPTIVINEIQHSPVAGNAAEFVELHNPGATAIDLSGWTFSGGIAMTVPSGTVILPGRTMTFAANDATFRATYGTTVFLGGRFTDTDRTTDDLAASETLTLQRRDGSVADTVTYGGAGWPDATGGPSLELTDPSADNADPANWARSTASGGSPGAGNGGVVATPPGAPTVGTATAGNASATVSWTAPASTGGSAITGYQVRVVNAGTGQQVGALRPAGATATSLTVTGLVNGTTYAMQVAAVNAVGQGAYSALSTPVTPAGVSGVPGAPVIGTPSQGAVGGALTAIARWTPPASTGGSPITGYQATALRMSSAAPDATVLSRTTSRVLGPGVRQREFDLSAGDYRFEVVAINANGASAPSARSAAVVPR